MPLATKANGMEGWDTVLKFNSPLHVKHLENLVELQKDKTYDYSGRTNTGEGRFTSGECPIFLTSSAFFGNVRANAKFDFGNAPMPYYPDVAGAPQNSIIGGASLWVMGGKSAQEYKGVAKFFTFLSETDRQVELHTKSGYLPITKAAYEKTKASGFYKEFPYLETPLLELTNKEPTDNSRGLRLGNMVQLRDVWCEEIEAALSGKKPAKQALDDAVSRGNADAAPVRADRLALSSRGVDPPVLTPGDGLKVGRSYGVRPCRVCTGRRRGGPWKSARSSAARRCPTCCSRRSCW